MASRRGDDPDEDDDTPRRRPPSRSSRPAARRGPRPPIRRWSDEEPTDDDEEEDEAPRRPRPHARRAGPPAAAPSGGLFHRDRGPKEPVYFRARDSVFFEPLVALAIIAILLVSLYAYTSNWPPMYVVESDSMQHGSDDHVGLINTGDLVLAQSLPSTDIVPYIVGAQTGHSTYGEYGDVILYHPNGVTTGAPIIHRAIVFIEVNDDGSDSIPQLSGLPCGTEANAVYRTWSTPNGCGTDDVRGNLTLYGIGWMSVTISVPLASLGRSSGFLTMGDNNFDALGNGDPDQPFLSNLVEPGWVIGVARGMLPWFGALKLLFDGNAGEVPPQSWQWMGLSVVAVIGGALLLHYALRAEGIEDPRRKADEEASEDDDTDEGPPPGSGGGSRWLHPLRSWRADHAEEADDEEPPARSRKKTGAPARGTGGRPAPAVGRSPAKRGRPRADPDDEDDSL